MPNAIARNFRHAYVAEVTPGTTPSLPLKIIRSTGGNGTFAPTAIESPELHIAETTDLIRTAIDSTHKIDGVLSYATLDDFLEAILMGTWTTNNVQAGNVKRTFTIEDQYTDAGVYVPWRGCLVRKLDLNFALGSIPTFSVESQVGTPPAAAATTTAGTGAATDANTNAVMSPISSIQTAQEGGSGSLLAGAPGVTSISLSIERPVVRQPQLGSLADAQTDVDNLMVKGSFDVYFPSKALFDKLLGDTLTSFSFTVGGAAALKYLFLMSKVKFNDGGPQAPQRGQPITQRYNFTALYDATNSSLKVTRTP